MAILTELQHVQSLSSFGDFYFNARMPTLVFWTGSHAEVTLVGGMRGWAHDAGHVRCFSLSIANYFQDLDRIAVEEDLQVLFRSYAAIPDA